MSNSPRFLTLFIVPTLAIIGLDMQNCIDQICLDSFPCINSNNISHVIVKGFNDQKGCPDLNVIDRIFNARSAGIPYVDVSLRPTVPYGYPAGQAADLVNKIREQEYRMVWVVVDSSAWTSNKTYNQNFIKSMINQLKFLKQKVGIKTSLTDWQNIVGLNFTWASDLPLYYVYYNKDPSFKDFIPFGGWAHPFMKLYAWGDYCNLLASLVSFDLVNYS